MVDDVTRQQDLEPEDPEPDDERLDEDEESRPVVVLNSDPRSCLLAAPHRDRLDLGRRGRHRLRDLRVHHDEQHQEPH